MTNILIITDLEGVSGVYDMANMSSCISNYNNEVENIIKRILSLKKYKIYICDCHDHGVYLCELEKKYPNITFYHTIWEINFDVHYDYSMLCGFHAKGGSKGILSHSFRLEFDNITLCDKAVGEIEIFINYLAFYNIKTIFVSADNVAIEDMDDYDGIKFITKYNDVFDYNIKENYIKMDCSIEMALDRKEEILSQTYDNGCIKVQIKDDYLINKLKEDYKVINDCLVFNNTLEFINELYNLCFVLNNLNAEQKKDMLLYLYKNYHNRRIDISNKRVKYLWAKDIQKLTISELKEVILFFDNNCN